MIMRPRQCHALLRDAVVLAFVTPEEHRRLGGIYTHDERLYGRVLRAEVSNLRTLGRARYRAAGINLTRLRQ